MSLRDRIREGAAEVFGFDQVEAENAELIDRFVEANADARMMARAVEDLDWQGFNTAHTPYVEPSVHTRYEDVKLAYLYYFNDPIVGRTVDLRTNYAFSRGVPKPKYRADAAAAGQDSPGQRVIDDFFLDDFNQAALFSVEAQRQKSTELQLQANIFLLLLSPEDQANESEEQLTGVAVPNVPTRIADLPQLEIVDIIMHPGNRKIPVYYKRTYTPRVYAFDTNGGAGSYEPGNPVTRYYRDWRFKAPTTWEGKPWGPDPRQIAKGRVYHISTNRTSEMKFGVPEVKRYIKWARGLNEYMHSRMNLVQALSQIAMRAKVRGGPRHVQQVAGALQSLSKLAQDVEGATDLRASRNQTRVSVENDGVDLEPMVSDTNSGNAVNDINTLKSQVAAGSGVPMHHLGGSGDVLASTTSMDAPLQRLSEATQQLWQDVYRDLTASELRRKNEDPMQLEVTMPPILTRDAGVIAQVIVGLMGAVDPNVANRDLVRWCTGQVIDAMGIDNVNELIDQFFPEKWVSPMEQTLLMGQAQMAMANQADPGAGGDPGAPGRAQLAAGTEDQGQSIQRGRRMAGVIDGPAAAQQDSQDRAQKRHDRALASPVEAQVLSPDQITEMVETMTEGVKSGDALAVLAIMDLPPELQEAGRAAMAALADDAK